MNGEIFQLRDRLVVFSEERVSLEEQITKIKNRYDSIIDENDSLIRWRSEAESEINESKKYRQELERETSHDLDSLRDENTMLREYTRKSADEIAELKEMLRLAEDNDVRSSHQLEQLQATKFTLHKESDEMRKALDHYKQICMQNESYVSNLLKQRDLLNQKLNETNRPTRKDDTNNLITEN